MQQDDSVKHLPVSYLLVTIKKIMQNSDTFCTFVRHIGRNGT